MTIEFTIDGSPASCPDGLTVAGALTLAGRRDLRRTGMGEPRGLLCGMGVCFECVMEIDGRPGVRSCMTLVRPGMRVVTQIGPPGLGART